MSVYDTTLRLQMIDQVSQVADKVSGKLGQLKGSFKDLQEGLKNGSQEAKVAMTDTLASGAALTVVFGAASAAVNKFTGSTVTSARNLELELQNLRYNSQMTEEQFASLSKRMWDTAFDKSNIYSMRDTVLANYELMSYGLNSAVTATIKNTGETITKQTSEFVTPAVLGLSTMTRGILDIGEAAAVTGALVKKFGIDFSQVISVNGRLITQGERFMDMLSKASQYSGLKPEQIAEVVRGWRASPSFANISAETALAFTSEMISQGNTPRAASVALDQFARNIATQLTRVTKKEIMDQLAKESGRSSGTRVRMTTMMLNQVFGTEEEFRAAAIDGATGRFRDPFEFLAVMEKKLYDRGGSEAQRKEMLRALFGTQEMSKITSTFENASITLDENVYAVDEWGDALTRNGEKVIAYSRGTYKGVEAMMALRARIRDSKNEMQKYTDLLLNTGEIISQQLGGRWENFKASFGAGMRDFVKDMQKTLIATLDVITKFMNAHPALTKFIGYGVAGAGASLAVLTALTGVIQLYSLIIGRWMNHFDRLGRSWFGLGRTEMTARGGGYVTSGAKTLVGSEIFRTVFGALGMRLSGPVTSIKDYLFKTERNTSLIGKLLGGASGGIEKWATNGRGYAKGSKAGLLGWILSAGGTSTGASQGLGLVSSGAGAGSLLMGVKGAGWVGAIVTAASAIGSGVSKFVEVLQGVAGIMMKVIGPVVMFFSAKNIIHGIAKMSGVKIKSLKEGITGVYDLITFVGKALVSDTGTMTASEIEKAGTFKALALRIVQTDLFKQIRLFFVNLGKFTKDLDSSVSELISSNVLDQDSVTGARLIGKGVTPLLGMMFGNQVGGPIGSMIGALVGYTLGDSLGQYIYLMNSKAQAKSEQEKVKIQAAMDKTMKVMTDQYTSLIPYFVKGLVLVIKAFYTTLFEGMKLAAKAFLTPENILRYVANGNALSLAYNKVTTGNALSGWERLIGDVAAGAGFSGKTDDQILAEKAAVQARLDSISNTIHNNNSGLSIGDTLQLSKETVKLNEQLGLLNKSLEGNKQLRETSGNLWKGVVEAGDSVQQGVEKAKQEGGDTQASNTTIQNTFYIANNDPQVTADKITETMKRKERAQERSVAATQMTGTPDVFGAFGKFGTLGA